MKTKNIYILLLVMVVAFADMPVFGQSANQNYIQTKTYTSASVTINGIQYFDGLGRPVETVQKQFTPAGKDLVSRTEYDTYGREYKHWLPAPNTKTDGTYNGSTTGAAFYGDAYPYSETVYEPSPLNRVKNQHGPGAAWRNLAQPERNERQGDSRLYNQQRFRCQPEMSELFCYRREHLQQNNRLCRRATVCNKND